MSKLYILGFAICLLSMAGCQSIQYKEVHEPDIYGNTIAQLRGRGLIQYVIFNKYHNNNLQRYRSIFKPHNGFYIAITSISNKYVFLDKYGQEISSLEFEEVFPFEKTGTTYLARVKANNKWGIINANGEYITPPTYANISTFYNETAIVYKDREGEGLINSDGELLLSPCYPRYSLQHIPSFNLFTYGKYSKMGIMDSEGKTITRPSYFYIVEPKPKEQYALACKGNPNSKAQWVLIDLKNGQEISIKEHFPSLAVPLMPYIEDNIISENIILLPFYSNGKAKYVYSRIPNFIWENIYEDGGFSNIYDKALPFSEGLAAVQNNLHSGYGYINTSGRFIIAPHYDDAKGFNGGIAAVKIGHKWGYVSSTGETIVHCKYDQAEDFCDGFAAVCINGQWGYINEKGEEVLPLKYKKVSQFTKNRALIESSGLIQLINNNMEILHEWSFIPSNTFKLISFHKDYIIDQDPLRHPNTHYYTFNGELILTKD